MKCPECAGRGYIKLFRHGRMPCRECMGSGIVSCCDTAGAPTIIVGRLNMGACLNCHAKMDAYTGTDGKEPDPNRNDVMVCRECSHVMILGSDGLLRELTDAEIVEVAGDPDIVRAVNLTGKWREYCERRDKRRASQSAARPSEHDPRAGVQGSEGASVHEGSDQLGRPKMH